MGFLEDKNDPEKSVGCSLLRVDRLLL